ncbi:MAG: TolC family protein, partial [Deltaproteobacteria bacterium]|nr:TolC family protein [Deltaproteobacteria bacterium]
MNMKNFFLTIGVVLLSGGCMLMPKYKRPDAPVPANLPSAGVTAEGQSQSEIPQAADLKWQEFFSDPKLRQVITIALKENRDLRIAALNVEHARALYGVQRAELFPSANVAGGKSRQRISSDFKLPGQPRTTEQFNVNFGIT